MTVIQLPQPGELVAVADTKNLELSLLQETQLGRGIQNQEDAELVAEHMRNAKAFMEWCDSVWDDRIAQAHRLHKGLCDDKRRLYAIAEQQFKSDRKLLMDWATVQEQERQRKLREEQERVRKAEEERQRQIREAEQKAAAERAEQQKKADEEAARQRQADLDFAQAMGDDDAVARLGGEPIKAELPPAAPVFVPPVPQVAHVPPVVMPAGVGVRKVWQAVVADENAFFEALAREPRLRKFVTVNQAELNRFAAYSKGTEEIAGIAVAEVPVPVSR